MTAAVLPAEASPARRPRAWEMLAAIALLIAITAAVFGPILANDFVGGWDDDMLIIQNGLLRQPAGVGLGSIWGNVVNGLYAPLTYTVYWLLAARARASGLPVRPLAFHLTSLLLHGGAGLLLWAWLRRLGLGLWPAAAGAAVWLVHPVQVEAVAWAASLNTVLAGFFGIAALALAAWCVPLVGWRRIIGLSLSVVMAWACVASKPSGVVLPFLLLAVHPFLLRRPWNETVAWAALWAAAALPMALVNQQAQFDVLVSVPLAWRPAVAAHAIGFYIAKIVWPIGLIMDYHRRPDTVIAGRWYGFALVAVVTVATLLVPPAGRRWRAAGAAVFVMGIGPVLGLVPFFFQARSTVADRYVYLAMFGTAIVVAATLQALARRGRTIRQVAVGATVAWVAALAGLAHRQVAVWHDLLTLSGHALAVDPDCIPANAYVGFDAQRRGDLALAETCYRRVLRQVPDNWGLRARLVILLCHAGRWDEANAELPALNRYRVDDEIVDAELHAALAATPASRP